MSNKRHLEVTKTLIKESSENRESSTQADEQDLEAEKYDKIKEANEKQANFKPIDCKFYTSNGCRRGNQCWFRHKHEGLNQSDCTSLMKTYLMRSADHIMIQTRMESIHWNLMI